MAKILVLQDIDGNTLQLPITAGIRDIAIAMDAKIVSEDMISNGSFATDFTDWYTSAPAPVTYEIVNGTAVLSRNGGDIPVLQQDVNTVAGKTYKVSLIVGALSDNGINIRIGVEDVLPVGPVIYGAQAYYFRALADSTIFSIQSRSSVNSVLQLDNVMIEEVSDFDMALNLDGVWASPQLAAYGGSLGKGPLTIGNTFRELRRYETEDILEQLDIIDVDSPFIVTHLTYDVTHNGLLVTYNP